MAHARMGWIAALVVVCAGSIAVLGPARESATTPPDTGWRPLWNGRDFAGWEVLLGRPMQGQFSRDANPKPVFRVVEADGRPAIRITGRIWGALSTVESFQDYHFRAEYRWTGAAPWPPLTWRDAGVLYHAVGEPRSTHVGNGLVAGATATPGDRSRPGSGFFHECLEYQIVEDVDAQRFGRRGHLVGELVHFGRALADLERFEPKDQRPGAWNLVEIQCVGTSVRHFLNGELVAEGRTARYAADGNSVPLTRGPIQLQSESGEIDWRGIEVRPLKKFSDDVGTPAPPRTTGVGPVAARALPPALSPTPGYEPLFNGRDLDGWSIHLGWPMDGQACLDRNPEPVFHVVALDGEPVLRVSGRLWGTLTTTASHRDYELRVEFRWGSERIYPPLVWRESGIMLHAFGPPGACVLGGPNGGPLAKPPGSGLYFESIEAQLSHRGPSDQATRDREIGRVFSRGRVRFDVVRQRAREQRPPGEWNVLAVSCEKNWMRTALNGTEAVAVRNIRVERDGASTPLTGGRISIQSESCEIFFRRIEIRPIQE